MLQREQIETVNRLDYYCGNSANREPTLMAVIYQGISSADPGFVAGSHGFGQVTNSSRLEWFIQ